MPLLYYSVNVFLKYHLLKTYRGDVHFVWASPYFDPRRQPAYSAIAPTAPSSNPALIYRNIRDAVEGDDENDPKINEQKVSLKQRAIAWHSAGEITKIELDDIIASVDFGPIKQWRPLIYVILGSIEPARVKKVQRQSRAGLGMEYMIEDLKGSEFDIIEVPPCYVP